jgi:hemoglobin
MPDYVEETPYELMGGAKTIQRLVDVFYAHVAVHPELTPIFPENLTETKDKQYKFLTQFFGGPPLYSQEHGHPMLRARHMPFPITANRAEAWLSCMNKAIDAIGLEQGLRDYVFQRLMQTAYHMVNHAPEE